MDTKERIKDRILKRAARAWGYGDQELETSFDPIVAMLLEACGAELEKLSSEQDNSRSRIIERLLEIMIPENSSGVFPSRAIVHAIPTENNFPLSLEHQLQTLKSIPNIYDPINPIVKKVTFGPTGSFVLTAAKLEYMAFGNNLYSLARTFHKDRIIESGKYLANGSLWLGIRLASDSVQTLEKLMFYTDIRNTHQQEVFYHNLRQAKIFHAGKDLALNEGYNNPYSPIDVESVITRNYNRIHQIYGEVNQYYASKFFHLEEDIEINEESFEVPEALENCFSGEQFNQLKNILWIEFRFPETMINEVLENAMFSLNCFPVINKTLDTASRGMDPFINYIPLETEEHFLDLNEISDSKGNRYDMKNFSEGNLESGNASLRNSGVVRFDERNASELIQYLLELLKDESASFSVLGGDFLNDNLKQLNQLIATLEQQTKEHDFTKSNFPYVIVRPQVNLNEKENEMISVEYWSCLGESANDIRPETRLTVHKGSDFVSNTIYMISSSVGGRSRLSTQEKILSFRNSLLTHGRVVTFADIKAFCLNHFKHTVSNVQLRKGTKIDSASNKGFERTIDILITRNQNLDPPVSESEWQYLCDNLMHKLDNVSSNIYPYRLIVS